MPNLTPEQIKELTQLVENPPPEVLETYRRLLDDLRKGLPPASSPEVLNSRMDW